MDNLSVLTPQRDIYREHERTRRLRLARLLLPIFCVIQALVFAVGVLICLDPSLTPTARTLEIVITSLTGTGAIAYGVGIFAARRGQVLAATLLLLLPAIATIMLPILIFDVVDSQVTIGSPTVIVSLTLVTVIATLLLITLAGLLSTDVRVLVAVTVVLNGLALGVLMYAAQLPGAGQFLHEQEYVLIPLVLLTQWTLAGLLFAGGGTYVRTLRELGDVSVAYERARQLDELKDQFISHVNHELRSPVMALHGFVELLLLTDESLSGAERRAYLERAKRAGDSLMSLIDNILDMRRLEQQGDTYLPARVPVAEVLQSALELLDPREGGQVERELGVEIPEGLAVMADQVWLRQILTNLLSNALKYSEPGTPVEIAASVVGEPAAKTQGLRRAQKGRDMVEITVRDHGFGVPPDQIPLLFERFVRLPRDLASSVPGNGLGLHLCRLLAERMGGRIWVESAGVAGEGSTFYLRLPLPEPEPEKTDAEPLWPETAPMPVVIAAPVSAATPSAE
jgi:signal transduction histidine kinase